MNQLSLALPVCCCLLACSSEQAPRSSLQIDTRTYQEPQVEARVVVSSSHHDLRLLAYVDPSPRIADSDTYIRVDVRIAFPAPGAELPVFGISRLSVEEPVLTLDLDTALDCARATPDGWQPLIEHACVSVFRHTSALTDVITQRVGGTVTIEALDGASMRGRVQLWAVGLDAETTDPEELQYSALFSPGVAIDVPFEADISQ